MNQQVPTYFSMTPTQGELQWVGRPNDELLGLQLAWIKWLKTEIPYELLEIRQGFTSIGIHWKTEQFQKRFAGTFQSLKVKPIELSEKIWEVPVCYESEYGKDLGNLALSKHMRVNDLIDLHSSTRYRIHFFGFLPGFMYLNGLPEALHTPRKSVPDRSISPGSVGIGGSQTGIYPMESPGGWHILGRTPLKMFDATQNPPVWAEIGDRIKFFPISSDEMKVLLEQDLKPESDE